MKFCRINLPVRLQNPWFWAGLLGAVGTAVGARPELFTSWAALSGALKALLANPYLLGCAAAAVLGVFLDPTTAGPGDSARALTYQKPYKEEKPYEL